MFGTLSPHQNGKLAAGGASFARSMKVSLCPLGPVALVEPVETVECVGRAGLVEPTTYLVGEAELAGPVKPVGLVEPVGL